MNALLVTLSPNDSASGTWAAAILTAAVIIPAMVQKRNQTLSFYHAVLVLNFATLSCITSLATAPMCTVWRAKEPLTPRRAVRIHGGYRTSIPLPLPRQRLVLSLALLIQVSPNSNSAKISHLLSDLPSMGLRGINVCVSALYPS